MANCQIASASLMNEGNFWKISMVSRRVGIRGSYPIIDVFAGPGGLGEGFAALKDAGNTSRFESVLSIEQDTHAHSTLLLRHFFRNFPDDEVPEDYYAYLSNHIDRDELFRRNPEASKAAKTSAIQLSLGPETRKTVSGLIGKALNKRKNWVLVGGPPCQAYSLVGRARMRSDPGFEDDQRHFLYKEYLQILADHRPPIFVMENVKGLLSAQVHGELMINRILADLSAPTIALGRDHEPLQYKLYSLCDPTIPSCELKPRDFLIRAEEYGVPQARHRMFIVGIRADINGRPEGLKPHTAPTVGETISDLPELRSGLSRQEDSHRAWSKALDELLKVKIENSPFAEAVNQRITDLVAHGFTNGSRSSSTYSLQTPSNHAAIAMLADPRLSVLTGHEARSHMNTDLLRYAFASVFAEVTKRSPKLADFPKKLLPDHRNVDLGRDGKMFADRFRVQIRDAVSTTITSHISKDGHYFIHYDPRQCRSLTVREAARLQTFPDNYKFEGPRTAQYHQVGNAVPTYLAKQIAGIIAGVLDRVEKGH